MFVRKAIAGAAGLLLIGSIPLVTGSTAGAAQGTPVVNIEGQDSFQPNNYLLNTYHFEPGNITVHQGQQVLFNNPKTRDGHTMTLVAAANVPRTTRQLFNCNLCNAVDGMYFPNPNGPPAAVQIDNGVLQDDNDTDADTPDPAAPGPFGALIEDFNTPGHNNGTNPPTVGDSALIGSVSIPGTPTSRTIVVTAAPGTVLHYYCTLHPWMQGTITVTA
jgi:plastocyanin